MSSSSSSSPLKRQNPDKKESAAKKANKTTTTTASSSGVNYNKDICDLLIEIADFEKNVMKSFHKSNVYRKAVRVLAAYPKRIESGAEAKKLDGIGEKIAKKIDEFIKEGKICKVEKIREDPTSNAIQLIASVHGIGPVAAQQFVTRGITTLEQLRKEKLNGQQMIGLKYYEEFKLRVPREEIDVLRRLAFALIEKEDDKLFGEVCGSFRRGLPTSGDIDIIISHPEFLADSKPKFVNGLLHRIVDRMQKAGFVTDVLSCGETKFMGVCVLPQESFDDLRKKGVKQPITCAHVGKAEDTDEEGTEDDEDATDDSQATDDGRPTKSKSKPHPASSSTPSSFSSSAPCHRCASMLGHPVHRRIDIKITPFDQFYFGILYFTGSDELNKEMRRKAIEMGLHLNEYCLRPEGESGTYGPCMLVNSEREIFELLDMDYIEPSKR